MTRSVFSMCFFPFYFAVVEVTFSKATKGDDTPALFHHLVVVCGHRNISAGLSSGCSDIQVELRHREGLLVDDANVAQHVSANGHSVQLTLVAVAHTLTSQRTNVALGSVLEVESEIEVRVLAGNLSHLHLGLVVEGKSNLSIATELLALVVATRSAGMF